MLPSSKIYKRVVPILGLVLLLGLWELNSRFRFYQTIAPTLSPATFPSLVDVGMNLGRLFGYSDSLFAMGVTLVRTFLAFLIAVSLGILLGLFTARVFWANALLTLPVEFLRNLPAVAALPIFLIFLGIGSTMKVALAVFGAVFPVFIATRSGLHYANEELRIAATYYRWKGWRLVFQVLLPSALSEIVGAAQTALAISFILVVTAEMLVGSDGLGGLLVDAERTFNYAQLYAIVILLGLFGTLLALLLRYASARVLFWKRKVAWENSSRG